MIVANGGSAPPSGGSTYKGPGDRGSGPAPKSEPQTISRKVASSPVTKDTGAPTISTEGMVYVESVYAEQHPEAVVEIDGKYYRPAISASQSREAKLVGLSGSELYAKTLEGIKSGAVAFGSISSAKSAGEWSVEVKARGVERERKVAVNEARGLLLSEAGGIRDDRMAILDPLQEEAKRRGTTNPLGDAWASLPKDVADELQKGIEREESIRGLASDVRSYSLTDIKSFLAGYKEDVGGSRVSVDPRVVTEIKKSPKMSEEQRWWVVASEGGTFRFGGLNFRPELLRRPALDTFELKPKKSKKEGILSTKTSGSGGLYNKGRQHVPTIIGG